MRAAVVYLFCLFATAPSLLGEVNRSCATGGDGGASHREVHGRLRVYNGGYPHLRLWHVGTRHLLGIFGDAADLRCSREGPCDGDQDTKLPSSLEALMKLPNPSFEFAIYGDFELRVLEPFQRGHMQAACIVNAHNLVRRRSN
jgi:hypothetical protein